MPVKVISQKVLFEYLRNNPLHVAVHVGELDDMNGKDYIFVDILSDELIGYDNAGTYKTSLQITVATKDFDDRYTLTKYVQKLLNVRTDYAKSYDYEYWVSRSKCEVVLCESQ